MDYEKFYIPKYLDAPERLFIFTYDEILAFLVPFILGLLGDYLLVGLTCSVVLYKGLKKLKSRGGFDIIRNLAYWYLPDEFNSVKTKNYKRRYI